MPSDIRKGAIALIASCVSTLIAGYFEGLEFEEISFNDPLALGLNLLWALIIVWIIWDLFRGKGIKYTLILVGAIMLAALIRDVYVFGYKNYQLFYAFELVMFFVAYVFINSNESKEWFKVKNM